MPKTLREARKKKKELDLLTPNMEAIIIDNRKIFPKTSSFRYNFRFKEKK